VTTLLFCHGLESGPHGRKYQALTAAGFEVHAPDCRGMCLAQRVEVITPFIQGDRPLIVGSSYGGITAVLAAARAALDLPGMVLCAPALEVDEPPNDATLRSQLPCPTTIVHGLHDGVIAIDVSRRFAARTGAKLIEVGDDHRLARSMDVILDAVRALNPVRVPP